MVETALGKAISPLVAVLELVIISQSGFLETAADSFCQKVIVQGKIFVEQTPTATK